MSTNFPNPALGNNEAQPVPTTSKPPISLGIRLLIGLAMIVGSAFLAGMFWIFGLLMFTFSLDGANSSDIPHWIETSMIVGWPILLGLSGLVPPILYVAGTKPKIWLTALAGLWLTSVGFPLIIWIITLSKIGAF